MKRALGRLSVACICLLGGVATAWTIHRSLLSAPLPVAVSQPVTRNVLATGGVPAAAVLWVLAIGVSQYGDSALNLQFAAADAHGIADVLSAQGGSGLYREVRARVLENQQVTRESILEGMREFLGAAGVDDVVVLFLAGHGAQEQTTGSYYFLPAPATPANMLTAGLRVSDLDQMIRALRASVRGVVVLLDTCHAGAVPLPAAAAVSGEELVSRFSAAEGTFLLAASRSGEESRELADLGHGAFSYALMEGVRGAADADRDGVLPISELFGYVARHVPALTDGLQHPYHRMEGTDLIFTGTAGTGADGTGIDGGTTVAVAAAPRSQLATNTIGVIELRNLRNDTQHGWMGKALRVAFNTELSKVGALRVYVPQLIDRTAVTSNADDLTVARHLGIHTLITGSFHVVGNTLRIDAEIVDVASGVQKASDSVEGDIDNFFQLQKTLVVSMLRRLRVQLSAEEGKSIAENTNTNVDAYRLLLESEGVVDEPAAKSALPTPSQHSSLSSSWRAWECFKALSGARGSALGACDLPARSSPTFQAPRPILGFEPSFWVRAAYALGPNEAAEEMRAAILRVLEAFRVALERKDTDALARVYTSFSGRHREALQSYFDNAGELRVEILDVVIEASADGALVSYTRRDRFTDRQSNKPVQLEARLAKRFVREGDLWKIGGTQ